MLNWKICILEALPFRPIHVRISSPRFHPRERVCLDVTYYLSNLGSFMIEDKIISCSPDVPTCCSHDCFDRPFCCLVCFVCFDKFQ
ncbi:hypothetical protein HanRHA438_Chr04g0167011 [Helianthus annuus]|nr:hypothetical protein HanRHA438_Chr04g0167011 [Helianthus annuus]